MKPVRPTYYDLGWLCLFWFCTGVFNGEIHCVQELGCHWAQSNQLSHRFNKQLPKDVITPQRCFHRDSITPLRSSFPLQHWPQWTSEHQRAVEHCSTLHSWVSCSVQNTVATESHGRSPQLNVQTWSCFLYWYTRDAACALWEMCDASACWVMTYFLFLGVQRPRQADRAQWLPTRCVKVRAFARRVLNECLFKVFTSKFSTTSTRLVSHLSSG